MRPVERAEKIIEGRHGHKSMFNETFTQEQRDWWIELISDEITAAVGCAYEDAASLIDQYHVKPVGRDDFRSIAQIMAAEIRLRGKEVLGL